MDVTNRFVLDFVVRSAAARPGLRVLDYGCGAGELVEAGRAAGVEMLGADVFYGGSGARLEAERTQRLGTIVHEIHGAKLPFAEGTFDLVVNNQVLEHVGDLDAVLEEIARVLAPGGVLLSLFPSRDVFREGHIGIPFAHWFPRDSRTRYFYALSLRALGLGTWKDQAPTRRQWARDKLAWIDSYTRYRTRAEIFTAFCDRFTSELREPDYIRFRLRDTPWLAPAAAILNLPFATALASALFRKLAFLVILSRKETT